MQRQKRAKQHGEFSQPTIVSELASRALSIVLLNSMTPQMGWRLDNLHLLQATAKTGILKYYESYIPSPDTMNINSRKVALENEIGYLDEELIEELTSKSTGVETSLLLDKLNEKVCVYFLI